MFYNSDKEKFQILAYQLNLKKTEAVFATLNAKNISPVLIKGLAAAQNYPKTHQRTFSDIDLAVDPKDFVTARRVIRENQFHVDLHRGLRHLDTLKWDELYGRTRFIKSGELEIRVLCPEDHLRVLCVHWLNDGGADRSRLWDIYFALENRADDFDWDRFLGVVDAKRRRWLITVLLLANKYFGLEIEEENLDLSLYSLPGWVLREVENEWKCDERLIPLNQTLHNRRQLIRQILKRMPPNALQALVETDEMINETPGFAVRFENILKRSLPSAKRFLGISIDE